MSLEVNKDEIYLVAPEGKYQNIAASWGDFMEKDFTLYTRAKVLLNESKIGEDTLVLNL